MSRAFPVLLMLAPHCISMERQAFAEDTSLKLVGEGRDERSAILGGARGVPSRIVARRGLDGHYLQFCISFYLSFARRFILDKMR